MARVPPPNPRGSPTLKSSLALIQPGDVTDENKTVNEGAEGGGGLEQKKGGSTVRRNRDRADNDWRGMLRMPGRGSRCAPARAARCDRPS